MEGEGVLTIHAVTKKVVSNHFPLNKSDPLGLE